MSKFLKGIKGMFFEEEEKKPEPKPEPTINVQTPDFGFNPVLSVSSNQPDSNVLKYLADEMEKNNLPGVDYFEFKKVLLTQNSSDEKTRFEQTFNAIKALSPITKEVLSETGKKYVVLLDSINSDFENQTAKKFDSFTGLKKKRISDIDALIIQKREEIEKLGKEIAEVSSEQMKLKSEVIVEENDKADKASRFKASVEFLKQGIEKDLVKIEQFI